MIDQTCIKFRETQRVVDGGVHLDFTQLWSNDSGIVPNSIKHLQIVCTNTSCNTIHT